MSPGREYTTHSNMSYCSLSFPHSLYFVLCGTSFIQLWRNLFFILVLPLPCHFLLIVHHKRKDKSGYGTASSEGGAGRSQNPVLMRGGRGNTQCS